MIATILLRADGRPRRLFRTLMLHSNGRPRGFARRWLGRALHQQSADAVPPDWLAAGPGWEPREVEVSEAELDRLVARIRSQGSSPGADGVS